MTWKTDFKKLFKMQHTETERENIKSFRMRSLNIYHIRVPEAENRENGGEAAWKRYGKRNIPEKMEERIYTEKNHKESQEVKIKFM